MSIKKYEKSFTSGYRIAHLVVRSASTSHHKELMVSLFDVQNKLEAINFSPALSHTEARHALSGDFFIIFFRWSSSLSFQLGQQTKAIHIIIIARRFFYFQFESAASETCERVRERERGKGRHNEMFKKNVRQHTHIGRLSIEIKIRFIKFLVEFVTRSSFIN